MVTRLTVTTVLIALFGIALSALAQNATLRPGSAFASIAGADCKYSTGIVCPIEREVPPTPSREHF
ncbi:MAG TPA: hypothetical protein VGO17_06295 [Aurantimonas sp.]|jgi:hypothetical protein|nr:hypothetical protein [Aurantimonas sp.]